MSSHNRESYECDEQARADLANGAYENIVKCFRKGNDAASLLFSNDETSSQLRGVLLGRSRGETATVNDLITCRLQHDIGYSEIYVKINEEILVDIPSFQIMNNAQIIDNLCLVVKSILQGFTDSDRAKFSRGKNEINRRVINFFFDVGKRNKLTMKDVGIPYPTCRKMITQCILWTNENNLQKFVTPKMATMAYRKFVGDKNGCHSEIINLNAATAGFGDRVRTILKQGYLDVTLALTTPIDEIKNSSETYNATNIASRNPYVEQYAVGFDRQGSKVHFQVLVMHNAVSPEFMRKWIQRMNSLAFLSGKGGRSNGYVRNASTTESPSPIVIGGKYVYASVPPDVMETQLIAICTLLANEQRTMIESKFAKLYKVTWHCNLVHTVVAAFSHALYGAHSDYSEMCCSDGDHCHVADDCYLPNDSEMQVATMVFSNSEKEFSTELVYSIAAGTGTKKRVEIQRIALSNCCIHWQGPGSQARGIKHHVESCLGPKDIPGVFRAHSTFRFTLDPIRNKSEFNSRLMSATGSFTHCLPDTWENEYNQFNVIDKCSGTNHYSVEDGMGDDLSLRHDLVGDFKSVPLDEEQLPSSQPKSKCVFSHMDLTSNVFTDLYKQVDQITYKLLAPPRSGGRARLAGTVASELSRGPAAQKLYESGFLLEVETEPNTPIGVFHTVKQQWEYKFEANKEVRDCVSDRIIPVPGKRYRLTSISADAGLIHKSRCHRIYCNDAGSQNVMILSQCYKNDEESVRRYIRQLDEVEVNGNIPFFNDDFDGCITIYGSGGAPVLHGAYCPTPQKDSKDDAMIVFPMSQDMHNPLNRTLMEMCYNKKVLTIYVNESLFNDSSGHQNTLNDTQVISDAWCRCLGIFYADSLIVREDIDDNLTLNSDLVLGFKSVPFLRVTFKPFLASDDMKELMTATGRKRKRQLRIPFGCNDSIDVIVPHEIIKSMRRSDVLDQYLASGRVNKYLVCNETTTKVMDDQKLVDCLAGSEESFDSRMEIDWGELYPEQGDESPGKYGEHASDDSGSSVISNDSWECESEHVGSLIVAIKQGKRTGICLKKGISVTTEELTKSMVLCSVAGANRFAKNCLRDVKGQPVAIPLCMSTGLPALFRVYPMPMPNRALDVVAVGLRGESVLDGVYLRCGSHEESRIEYKPDFWGDLLATTFKAILLRYTGRLNAFSLYAKIKRRRTLIPKIEDISQFLAFMRTTVNPKNHRGKLRGWVSDQHAHSIPHSSKEYLKFERFLKCVGTKLPHTLRRIISEKGPLTNNGDERSRAVTMLSDMLRDCTTRDDTGNVSFIAQQVLADVEEIFADPFGPIAVRGIILGNGSDHGFYMIKNSDISNALNTVEQVFQAVIGYVNEEVNDLNLNMMGYKRIQHRESTVVFNQVNGRPFSATDVEHFLCKAWLIAKYTLPNYSTAKQPRSTKPHCHPINLRGEKLSASTGINTIMEGIACMSTSNQNILEFPRFCMMNNENDSEAQIGTASENTFDV